MALGAEVQTRAVRAQRWAGDLAHGTRGGSDATRDLDDGHDVARRCERHDLHVASVFGGHGRRAAGRSLEPAGTDAVISSRLPVTLGQRARRCCCAQFAPGRVRGRRLTPIIRPITRGTPQLGSAETVIFFVGAVPPNDHGSLAPGSNSGPDSISDSGGLTLQTPEGPQANVFHCLSPVIGWISITAG
jgi:hypothetical protein